MLPIYSVVNHKIIKICDTIPTTISIHLNLNFFQWKHQKFSKLTKPELTLTGQVNTNWIVYKNYLSLSVEDIPAVIKEILNIVINETDILEEKKK